WRRCDRSGRWAEEDYTQCPYASEVTRALHQLTQVKCTDTPPTPAHTGTHTYTHKHTNTHTHTHTQTQIHTHTALDLHMAPLTRSLTIEALTKKRIYSQRNKRLRVYAS